jgi:hypothetical protein
MTFFKKYSGTTNVKLVRLERSIWVLIYGGLLAITLGAFIESSQGQDGTDFYIGGAVAVLVGVVMIYLRSRLREEN